MLAATGIDKSYPGVRALRGVDFEVRAGEVHALMGENGAGKSTLIRVLTGAVRPDAGTVEFLGRAIRPSSPAAAQRLGIAAVHQEINLIPGLSVAENLFLGRFPLRWGRIDRRKMRRLAEAALAPFGARIDPDAALAGLSIALRQIVAIARAVDQRARLLVLDEPTSSLDAGECERLFGVVRALRERGLGIVFITHFIGQAYRIADRITVLRNGAKVGTFPAAELPRVRLVAHMIGRAYAEGAEPDAENAESHAGATAALPAMPAPAASASSLRDLRAAVLSVRRLGRRGAVAPFDLDIAPGEVVGLAGLLGSGRTEAARLIFAADRPDRGWSMKVAGREVRPRRPRDAIALGIAMTPEDRKDEGLFAEMSVRDNIVIVVQRLLGRLVRRREQARIAERFVRELGIATPDLDRPVRLLSGGNQQKVILARWLAGRARVLILDEPTRGMDVGAKAQVEALVARLAAGGLGVLFISSELDEAVRRCARIVVLRERRVVAELAREDGRPIPEERVMAAIAG